MPRTHINLLGRPSPTSRNRSATEADARYRIRLAVAKYEEAAMSFGTSYRGELPAGDDRRYGVPVVGRRRTGNVRVRSVRAGQPYPVPTPWRASTLCSMPVARLPAALADPGQPAQL